MTENILSDIFDDYNKSIEDRCPKFGGPHDYEQLDQQFISKQVVELYLICLECGEHKYIYRYMEEI